MQVMMVTELQRVAKLFSQALIEDFSARGPMPDRVVVGLVQALASHAVERKFSVTAEEMAVAGFVHAQTLSSNQRFLENTMAQQQIIMSVAQLASDPSQAASLVGQGCSVM